MTTLDFLVQSPVEHFARTRPQHPAFRFKGQALSYAELDQAANRLAHALLRAGVTRGARVGVYMHKGLELGPALYGILKAGAAFVPLDPFLPLERLAFILADCGIAHVVSADALAPKLVELAARDLPHPPTVFGVSAALPFPSVPPAELAALPSTRPDVWTSDQDLAYIMYTSGSTGSPKGMLHTHRGSLSYARWGALHVGLVPEDRVASHAPLHFDLSIFDLFSTAQAGATVVLVPEPVTRFPASWTQCIQDEAISVVFTVPFTLIEMFERGAMDKRELGSLRWILFGGEPFPPKHLRALMRALPGVRFTNVYGPAEAPSCTCYDVPGEDDGRRAGREPWGPEPDAPLPIGTVSWNSDDLIVDEDDAPLGVDEPGELCIRSSTLTRGYWNRPDLNARAFLLRAGHGPFPEVYFRTGDLVVRRADGLLRFLGRRDRMVKTRGHRVELDEVEAALASHPAVAEAAAFTVEDAAGTRTILAAATLLDDPRGAEAGTLAPAAILQHARGRLPAYAVPRELTLVSEFPRTTSGKIDRRRLGAEHPSTTDAADGPSESTGPTEAGSDSA